MVIVHFNIKLVLWKLMQRILFYLIDLALINDNFAILVSTADLFSLGH